jgi:NitT/TauT family transport system permease protein
MTSIAKQPLAHPLPASAARRRGRWALLRRFGPFVITLALLGLWELMVWALGIKSYVLPAPSRIAEELVTRWPLLWQHTGITFYETVLGFFLAAVIGIGLALVIVIWPPLERGIMPLLIFSQTIPKIAIAPIFIIWFGFGTLPKVLVAFLICFFPIVVDSVVGLRSVPPEMLHLVRSMGASAWQAFVKIRVPAALPSILAGLKVAVTLAVVGAVVGEWVGADRGLGFILLQASSSLQTPLSFAAIAVLTIIGVVLYYLLELLEHLLIPWHVSKRQPGAGPTL